MARAEQQDGGQRDPAAHGMHHDRTGKVVELFAEAGLQPGLDAEGLIPGDALEEGAVSYTHLDVYKRQLQRFHDYLAKQAPVLPPEESAQRPIYRLSLIHI